MTNDFLVLSEAAILELFTLPESERSNKVKELLATREAILVNQAMQEEMRVARLQRKAARKAERFEKGIDILGNKIGQP